MLAGDTGDRRYWLYGKCVFASKLHVNLVQTFLKERHFVKSGTFGL